MQKQRAFTLIELLVVIAIIGLLTTLVLVNTSGTRGKAQIAQGLQFSGHLYNTLGSEVVGIWNFDNGTGTVAYDTSGYGNNGTISGALFATDTPYNLVGLGTDKYSMFFDGVNDYISVGNSSVLNTHAALTYELWFKKLGPGEAYPIVLGAYDCHSYYGIRLSNTTNSIYFEYGQDPWDGTNFSYAVGATFSDSSWHHYAVAYDGTVISGYSDGKYVGQKVTSSGLKNGNHTVYIGGVNTSWGDSNTLIDDVRIYGVALSASEIQRHYAEGLEKHGATVIR